LATSACRAQVQALAARLAQAVVQRLADQRVPERAGRHPCGAVLAEDAGPQCLLDRLDDRRVFPAGHPAEQGELELPAEHGGHLQQLTDRSSQARQAPGENLPDSFGNAGILRFVPRWPASGERLYRPLSSRWRSSSSMKNGLRSAARPMAVASLAGGRKPTYPVISSATAAGPSAPR
jgi:hypothetical protein